ncbi:MAG TPA: sigma-70 family RNA polymerase sigma factor [Candidatus Limnocylindrales bacterium]|nr:sigma-70 family RNA polymerase sigma factor [Candidatus Limnocylindrales bacterium]
MAGDHDAFAALANANVDRMYALARVIVRDADRAEDATQEALVRAWRELPRLREPAKFQAWLRRLLVNACYDEGRRIRSRSEVVLLADHHPSIADESAGVIDRDRLDRAFRRLPLEQRVVTVLSHVEGLTHEEIAETLGIPLGTVKSRVRYALAGLRSALEADDRTPAVESRRRAGGTGRGA